MFTDRFKELLKVSKQAVKIHCMLFTQHQTTDITGNKASGVFRSQGTRYFLWEMVKKES